MKNDTIFVSIASYRDPELLPTLRNMFETAKYPNRLTIGIAWQHSKEDSWDTLKEFKKNSKVKIIDIPAETSKGVCWARAQIQELYNGEKYLLQLDSHHRFIDGWDEELIKMFRSLIKRGHKKPLITAYLPAYFPNNDPEGRLQELWKMNFDYFLPEGPVFTRPSAIENYKDLKSPLPSRFLSAHCIFTLGEFCNEVLYDPMLYFHGEEISLAVRAFTHGYDLFHPHKLIIWHEYTRSGKKKHWDDNSWGDLDKISYSRIRKLFRMDNEIVDFEFGSKGLGTERSLEEYELYAGLRFKTRQVHQHTLDRAPPPIEVIDADDFESKLCNRFKYCINVYKDSVPEPDYDFWVVAFKDITGVEIHRRDADGTEVKSLLAAAQSGQFVNLWREFDTSVRPATWLVWPHSESKGWLPIIDGKVGT